MAELTLAVFGVAVPMAEGLIKISRKLNEVKNAFRDIGIFEKETFNLGRLVLDFHTNCEDSLQHLDKNKAQERLQLARSFLEHLQMIIEMTQSVAGLVITATGDYGGAWRQYMLRWKWVLKKSLIKETRETMQLFILLLRAFGTNILIEGLHRRISNLEATGVSISADLRGRLYVSSSDTVLETSLKGRNRKSFTKALKRERKDATSARKKLLATASALKHREQGGIYISERALSSILKLGRSFEKEAVITINTSQKWIRTSAKTTHKRVRRDSISATSHSAVVADGSNEGESSHIHVQPSIAGWETITQPSIPPSRSFSITRPPTPRPRSSAAEHVISQSHSSMSDIYAHSFAEPAYEIPPLKSGEESSGMASSASLRAQRHKTRKRGPRVRDNGSGVYTENGTWPEMSTCPPTRRPSPKPMQADTQSDSTPYPSTTPKASQNTLTSHIDSLNESTGSNNTPQFESTGGTGRRRRLSSMYKPVPPFDQDDWRQRQEHSSDDEE